MYYTDIASTLSVVIYYGVFLRNQSNKNAGFISKTLQIVLALASLWFRQTNIFWVAVAPLLLEAVHRLDQSHQVVKESMYQGSEGFGDSIFSILKASWRFEAVYDPPVSNAYLNGQSHGVAYCWKLKLTSYRFCPYMPFNRSLWRQSHHSTEANHSIGAVSTSTSDCPRRVHWIHPR